VLAQIALILDLPISGNFNKFTHVYCLLECVYCCLDWNPRSSQLSTSAGSFLMIRYEKSCHRIERPEPILIDAATGAEIA
jgi:hypothetical protein